MISNCGWRLWSFNDNIYVQYTKHEQWIQDDIGLEVVARQSPKRKIFSIFFDYTKIMINILILFFTQYFQKKWFITYNLPFQPKSSGFNVFLQFFWFFYEWNEWGRKKLLGNFFKLDVLMKKGYVDKMVARPCSPREKRKIFLKRKGLNYLKEQLFFWGKRD